MSEHLTDATELLQLLTDSENRNTALTAERDKYRDACERLRVMFAVATPITLHGHGDNYGGLGIQQISGYSPPVRFNPIFCTEKSALEWMKTNNIRGRIVELQIYDDFARQVKAELEGIEGSEIEVGVE